MSIDLTEAVAAMHGALASRWMTVADALSEDADYPTLLGDMLSAAFPHIEAEVRAQVADEIEAEYDRRRKILDHLSVGYHEGFLDALDAADLLALLDAADDRADAAQVNIQWKGFEACLDVNCPCGNFFHVDEWTFGRITCPACNTSYSLPHGVTATPEGDPS